MIETKQMFDLSTAHITAMDIVTLEHMSKAYWDEQHKLRFQPVPFRVLSHEYGFVVYVGHEVDELIEECTNQKFTLSEHFWSIMRKAYEQKVILINFDSDADQSDELGVVF